MEDKTASDKISEAKKNKNRKGDVFFEWMSKRMTSNNNLCYLFHQGH